MDWIPEIISFPEQVLGKHSPNRNDNEVATGWKIKKLKILSSPNFTIKWSFQLEMIKNYFIHQRGLFLWWWK